MKYHVIAALLAVARAQEDDYVDPYTYTWENGPKWMVKVGEGTTDVWEVRSAVPMGSYMQLEFMIKHDKKDVIVFEGRDDCKAKDGYAYINKDDGILGRINDDYRVDWRDLQTEKFTKAGIEFC